MSRHIVAVDIGGTFTDVVLMDLATGESTVHKVLTTPRSPVECVRVGVTGLLDAAGLTGGDLEAIVHATTLATNVITEGKGARVILLTTAGFRDVLETGREGRYDSYDLQIALPPPLVVRRDRLPVGERMDYAGHVVEPLTGEEVQRLVDAVRDGAPDAVAISLLHAYANSSHEAQLAAAIGDALPGIPISISADVLPKQGEYERTVATVVNSYVRPTIAAYLEDLEHFCRSEIDHRGPVFLMMSNGGMAGLPVARRFPVRMIESGPAAGVIGAARLAQRIGAERVLSFDMGGTTAKAAVIEDFRPTVASNLEVARLQRFAAGSGYPIALPSIDLLEIGAGGGSIARVNELGLLEVGPDSAGSEPGPVCYGRGGTLPTVTDANMVLGLLNPGFFLGGRMTVDAERARAAIDEHLAQRLDQDALRCAWGVFDVVNENMARALRIHAVEQGVDPRACSMVAFGGAGPVHACAVAGKLGVDHIVCPPGAGVGSAYGLIVAPRVSEEVRTFVMAVDDIDDARAAEIFQELVARAADDQPVASVRRLVDLRLAGQSYELTLALEHADVLRPGALRIAFDREYERRLGRPPTDAPVEIVNWHVQVTLDATSPPGIFAPDRADDVVPPASPLKGTRTVHLGPAGTHDADVWDRYMLDGTHQVTGPALIEERESTLVVMPGFGAHVDAEHNIQLRRSADAVPGIEQTAMEMTR